MYIEHRSGSVCDGLLPSGKVFAPAGPWKSFYSSKMCALVHVSGLSRGLTEPLCDCGTERAATTCRLWLTGVQVLQEGCSDPDNCVADRPPCLILYPGLGPSNCPRTCVHLCYGGMAARFAGLCVWCVQWFPPASVWVARIAALGPCDCFVSAQLQLQLHPASLRHQVGRENERVASVPSTGAHYLFYASLLAHLAVSQAALWCVCRCWQLAAGAVGCDRASHKAWLCGCAAWGHAWHRVPGVFVRGWGWLYVT